MSLVKEGSTCSKDLSLFVSTNPRRCRRQKRLGLIHVRKGRAHTLCLCAFQWEKEIRRTFVSGGKITMTKNKDESNVLRISLAMLKFIMSKTNMFDIFGGGYLFTLPTSLRSSASWMHTMITPSNEGDIAQSIKIQR